jgi:hypothetical protein
MSVLACDRNDCGNIMCDRYSHEYGYICDECYEELLHSGIQDIQKFMDSPKREDFFNDEREEYLSGVFQLRDMDRGE